MALDFTPTALLFTATATALRTTGMALDITAIDVAALMTRIACRRVAERGGEQWIGQIAEAMSAAPAAVKSCVCSSTYPSRRAAGPAPARVSPIGDLHAAGAQACTGTSAVHG